MDINEIIQKTVDSTVIKLKMAKLIKDDDLPPYEKTVQILLSYNMLKKAGSSKAAALVTNVDKALETMKQDPYYQIIPIMYFDGKSREYAAEQMDVNPTTISRNKKRLLSQLTVLLFSDEYIDKLIF